MPQEKFSITTLVSNDGCFDLQFRKDTRHERTNAPTYYRWKTQFIVTVPKENAALLKKVKTTIGCGAITIAKNQARLSVQKLDDIAECIVPFFKKNALNGNKKRCFDMWQRAVEIIVRNKGKKMMEWKKSELMHLMEIHKSIAKYKTKPKKQKWADMAKMFTIKN
jgi:hypothetical protein